MTTQDSTKTVADSKKSAGKKPEFNVCYSFDEAKPRQIGACWLHEDGGGMSVKLNAQCLVENLTLFPRDGNGFEAPEESNKPVFNVYNMRIGETRFGQVGSAWIHKKGGGINISLNAPCLISDLVLFRVKRKDNPSKIDPEDAENVPTNADVDGFEDEIPF